MQKIFQNKLFIVLCLSIVLLFSLISSCFASYDMTFNDKIYKFPDEFRET
jgi:cell division protein FtsL